MMNHFPPSDEQKTGVRQREKKTFEGMNEGDGKKRKEET